MKYIILTVVALLTSLWVEAQPPKRGADGIGNHTQFQIELITRNLGLSEKQADKFKQLYTQYTAESSKLRITNRRAAEQQSEQQIEQQILQSFDLTDQNTALKREYYHKFREVLTASQILEMYDIEREFRTRINAERQRRIGPPPPQD